MNLDQIALWNPPPQPAKKTDSRYNRYFRITRQTESWELDALDPATLDGLIETAIRDLRDEQKWQEAMNEQEEQRKLLNEASDRWESVVAFLENGGLKGTKPDSKDLIGPYFALETWAGDKRITFRKLRPLDATWRNPEAGRERHSVVAG